MGSPTEKFRGLYTSCTVGPLWLYLVYGNSLRFPFVLPGDLFKLFHHFLREQLL